MVSLVNISAHEAEPQCKKGRNKISGGPLYPLAEIKVKSNNVQLITRKCIKDVGNLGFDEKDVSRLLKQLEETGYIDSEWCQCTPNGTYYAACDAYGVSQREYSEVKLRYIKQDYYLKFALKKNGDLVLIVSCHMS